MRQTFQLELVPVRSSAPHFEGLHELRNDVLGIGGAPSIARDQQLAARLENGRHLP